jgi:hypothetical protein
MSHAACGRGIAAGVGGVTGRSDPAPLAILCLPREFSQFGACGRWPGVCPNGQCTLASLRDLPAIASLSVSGKRHGSTGRCLGGGTPMDALGIPELT